MTTLNTIIEEEKKAFEAKFSYGGFGGLMPQHRDGGRILMGEVQDYLATAMQRAYEAGQAERDTYWKEREKEVIKSIIRVAKDSAEVDRIASNRLRELINEDNLK